MSENSSSDDSCVIECSQSSLYISDTDSNNSDEVIPSSSQDQNESMSTSIFEYQKEKKTIQNDVRYSTLLSQTPMANSTFLMPDTLSKNDSFMTIRGKVADSDDEEEKSSCSDDEDSEEQSLHSIHDQSVEQPKDDEDSDADESIITVARPRRRIMESDDESTDIVQVSSEEDSPQPVEDVINCKRSEYNQQLDKIKELQDKMLKTKSAITHTKLSSLPDNGERLKRTFENIKQEFQFAQERLRKMNVTEEDIKSETSSGNKHWDNIRTGIATVQPKTFGIKGLQNYDKERALTAECLQNIHGSLETCPNENVMAEDPAGLKVLLMEHQKRALKWLMYREKQKPSGGILADDMGLGKTLSMISLILASTSEKENSEDDKNELKYSGESLIICPASLINQWSNEIETKVKRGRLSFNVYHGPKRETKRKRLAGYDVVITTYQTIMSDNKNDGPVYGIRWRRLILDEAHQIRNYKTMTSEACFALTAKSRWALTGTPVHNKELDMYALLKFLRCSPFDDLAVWKRWISDKSSGGGERLHAVISSLMLRRTKTELMDKGKLNSLPPRELKLIPISLEREELEIYQKVLLFSQTLFAQFLHQRAEKNQEILTTRSEINGPNGEYFKMRQKLLKLNKMKDVSGHEILVLLLRLRQICCHPFLITKMLEGNEDLGEGESGEAEELNLLEQLNKLNLEDGESENQSLNIDNKGVGLSEATKGILNPNHPVFDKNRLSSKLKHVMNVITDILETDDKIVVVSQWVGYLNLLAIHLKEIGVNYLELNGSIPTDKRFVIIDSINNPKSKYRILLLSMTAGGVGLNLAGANHLLLLDLHWNPQIENQAQDRIYRMGQKKEVHVYKFMTSDTIEERIKNLQEMKMSIADSVLTGSKQVSANKLSLADLKVLFNM